MAGRRSVVRWRDWCEWRDVYDGLFSTDTYAQQRAVSCVAAWRSRGAVPVSVNATAQLVEIALHERMADHQHHAIGVSARSHMELSLAYASAIVRCVNGLVDGSQKGAYAMAVSALAQRIGIPLWIVDLRHESTHNQLPSLPMLRFAANHLSAWLRSNYWLKQDDVIRSQVRATGAALLSRLPLVSASEGTRVPLNEALDAEKLRENVVPLLVDGVQYDERVFPVGALFLPEYVPETDATKPLSETEALFKYPKSDLATLLLDLQSLWTGMSSSLLSSLCEKVMDTEEEGSAQVEVGFYWIKLLLSNDWRERLKYADEPIDAIYRSGASMLARAAAVPTSPVIDRLRTTLRACKGVRNHSVVTNDSALRKQLDALTTPQWTCVNEWNPSPLGLINGFSSVEMADRVEFPLELDQEASLMSSSLSMDLDADEDDAIDRLMDSLDAEYDERQKELQALQRIVHDHVVHGRHTNGTQKILPQQEVERIQNEIEIW